MEITVQTVFNSWMNSLNETSKNKYNNNVQEFCKLVLNKRVEELVSEDLNNIVQVTVSDKYINELKDRELKNSTIRYKMKNVSQFFRKLQANRVFPDVNYDYIITSALSYRALKNDTERTKKMSFEDMEGFKDWLINDRYTSQRYAYKGKKSAMLVDLLYTTGTRISSAFDIKWTDIKDKKDTYGNRAYVIKLVGKGNKVATYPITDTFYNKLRGELFDGNEDDLLFKDVSQRNFNNDMAEFAKELDIEESFTPHSLRALAITDVYHNTGGDIHKSKEFANHESIETTIGYIQDTDNFLETGSYLLSSETITIEDIEYMSKEELLNIIGKRQDVLNYIYRERV